MASAIGVTNFSVFNNSSANTKAILEEITRKIKETGAVVSDDADTVEISALAKAMNVLRSSDLEEADEQALKAQIREIAAGMQENSVEVVEVMFQVMKNNLETWKKRTEDNREEAREKAAVEERKQDRLEMAGSEANTKGVADTGATAQSQNVVIQPPAAEPSTESAYDETSTLTDTARSSTELDQTAQAAAQQTHNQRAPSALKKHAQMYSRLSGANTAGPQAISSRI